MFSEAEITLESNDFTLTGEITRGKYGLICGGVQISTSRDIALKFFGYTCDEPQMNRMSNEIKILDKLKSAVSGPQILGIFYDDEKGLLPAKLYKERFPIIVVERLRGGDILSRLFSTGKFTESAARIIFGNVINAVHGLHSVSVIHCNLKAEHIVFCSTHPDDLRVQIVSFGDALILPDNRCDYIYDNSKRGSEAFIAPETLNAFSSIQCYLYSKQTDVWQVGCLLYCLLFARLPFGKGEEAEALIANSMSTALQLPPSCSESISPEAWDLLLRMLDKDPATRISTSAILAHPWLTDSTLPMGIETKMEGKKEQRTVSEEEEEGEEEEAEVEQDFAYSDWDEYSMEGSVQQDELGTGGPLQFIFTILTVL